FAKHEPRDVRRRTVGVGRVVDACKMHIWIRARDRVDVARKDEPDADDQIEAARGKEAQGGLTIFAPGRLEKAHVGAKLSSRALEPLVGRVVEAFVAAPTDVEHEPHAHLICPRAAVTACARRTSRWEKREKRRERKHARNKAIRTHYTGMIPRFLLGRSS